MPSYCPACGEKHKEEASDENLQSILVTVVGVFAAIWLWSFRSTPPMSR